MPKKKHKHRLKFVCRSRSVWFTEITLFFVCKDARCGDLFICPESMWNELVLKESA